MTHHAAPVLGELIDQPTRKPSAKLQAVGASGLAVGVLVYLAQHYAHLTLPEPVAEAIVLAGGWVGGYVKRDKAVAAVVTRVEHALTPITTNPLLAPVIDQVLTAAEEAVRGPEAAPEPATVPTS